MQHLAAAGRPTERVDPANFEGAATLQRFLSDDRDLPGRVYRVHFEAGSRTHWHTHTGVQLLYVVEGCCRVQIWEGDEVTASAGDVVRIETGEKHWHGAASDGPMVHLAVNLGDATSWLEPVSGT